MARRAGMQTSGGALHTQGFVGAEFVQLLQTVSARPAGGLVLKGEMHALMASVLLRMGRLDALDLNAEPEPPYRKLQEVEQGIRAGKRNAVVGAARHRIDNTALTSLANRRPGAATLSRMRTINGWSNLARTVSPIRTDRRRRTDSLIAYRNQVPPVGLCLDASRERSFGERHGGGLGYARVSTAHQDVANQSMRLTRAGVIKVFADGRSGQSVDRPGLDALPPYAPKATRSQSCAGPTRTFAP
jgi:Resolvase, N terminal domain